MMRNFLIRLLLTVTTLACLAGFASAQSVVPYADIILTSRGTPAGGASVAVCGNPGLATTGAQIISNVAVFTMSSNPVTAGFVANMTLTVSGFTGADVFFNGTFTSLTVTSTTITAALVHANVTASTNGSIFQTGTASQACAPLSSIFSDSAGLVAITQPGFVADGLGNFAFYATPANYNVQFYGPVLTMRVKPTTLPCSPALACTHSGPETFASIISATPNPAPSGFIRSANIDSSCWNSATPGNALCIGPDILDVFHVRFSNLEIDCPAAGVAACGAVGGSLNLVNNDNPGVNGSGMNIYFQQRNSAGIAKNPFIFNCGFATTTAGAEEGVCDLNPFIFGVQYQLAIGGIVGGGANPFVTPSADNIWTLGNTGTRWKNGYFVALASPTIGPSAAQQHTLPAVASDTIALLNATQTFGAGKTLTSPVIATGVAQGSGLKHQRVASCTTAAVANSTCNTTVTWTGAFADANYTPVCQVGPNVTAGVFLVDTPAKVAASITVTIQNVPGSAAAGSTMLNCVALHD